MIRFIRKLRAVGLGLIVTLVPIAAAHPAAAHETPQQVFLRDAVINADLTQVTLPLYRGVSGDQDVYFIVTESSSRADAARRGVNFAPKLDNAKGTEAVQPVTIVDGAVIFPATVDFSPERVVVPGPDGFPPLVAQPGAVGDAGYSPLIELPNGVVLNAAHVANTTGVADKVISLDADGGRVVFELTSGFYESRAVRYISTEASDPLAAALENVTFVPGLGAAPAPGVNDEYSAREKLAAFVNGQTGAGNPERQGLSSALLDGLSPLNVINEVPEGGRFPDYSPIWDIHLSEWTAAAVAGGLNVRQTDFAEIEDLVAEDLVTGPGGSAFGPSGFVVNCPVISAEH